MKIYFYPECNFNINKARLYDCENLKEWFGSQNKNHDDYEMVGKDGEYHDCNYEGEVCAVYPKIMGGKKKGKNILTAVVGLALVLATGGTTAALFANYGGLNMAHTLGAGLLLSGGGALLMGKMKMPSMDLSSDSATKQSYQWNVGNLSTSRGVKGVTFGSNVIPEGELLAYRTYGTSSLEKITRSETYYVNETYKTGKSHWDERSKQRIEETATRRVAKTRTVADSYLLDDESSYLEILVGAGEGELDSITDIKINDISLSDLNMVENTDYAIRLGSNTQTALKQTNLDSQVGYSSIGQTVPVKLNGSVTPLLITTPEDCDSCQIAFQAPGWYLYDTSSGAKNKAYIKLKIGYRVSGSTGSYTYINTGVSEIDSGLPIKAESAFYFQVAIKFPSNGTYQICIENDSAELNNTKGLLSNTEYSGSALPDRASININCDNIACYNNKEQTYPNTALIWLRIPASQTLNGSMPKITWKQTRANIYAYNGSSYVTKPANNLAWAIYDIIAQVRKDSNTYHNEGEDVTNIDFDKFVAFATFCESIGAMGNWFLNKLDTSWNNAMSVATSCRAFIGLRSGKVCPYWDAPTEMTQIFTVGNYEDMSGVITAKKDRAKAIEATFNNEEEKYASRTVRVEIDNDHSAEAVSMTFVGLSDPVNVSKQAHYILRRNKYLVQSIKFTADIDSIVCELNDVIGVQCDLTEYGVGGRIFKVENNVISLDAPVTLVSGNSYALLVRHTDGTLERNIPVETNGTYTQLTFNNAWSKPVLKGDVYSFGIANSEVRKYRVTGITRTNDLKAQIEATEYNENVYNELAVAPYTYTNPNAGINNVTTTYTPEAVELAWDTNNNTSYVNVYVDGVFYGRYKNGAEIPNINNQQQIELVPVNEYGEEDTAVVRTISNNLPTPSTPPVPIVQSTTTGCVAEFSGIPKNENIVWLIIKEGNDELGRVNILGEYMSVSIQLKSGTHTLSAYFVNQFSKSSQARTFTATPLNDITANNISATALKMPTGSILRLSAKNCTTASIAETNGVKDVSGNGNHGQAFGGVTVLDGGEGFGFDGSDDYILINNSIVSSINGLSGLTITYAFARGDKSGDNRIFGLRTTSGGVGGFWYVNGNTVTFYDRLKASDSYKSLSFNVTDSTEWHLYSASVDYSRGLVVLYCDGLEVSRNTSWFTGTKADIAAVIIGTLSPNGNNFKGKISKLRIDPRALSASEIKTIFMFPDDVTFGQLTTDMFGANIIHAKYILNDGYFQSLAVEAVNAKIQDLNVVGNATFQSTLNSAIDDIEVGGRNLTYRLKSAGGKAALSADKNTITVKYATSGLGDTYFKLNNTIDLVQGKTYTISCDVSGMTSGDYVDFWLGGASSSLPTIKIQNGHCVKTFTNNVSVSAGAGFLIDDATRRISTAKDFTITNFKLEEGNKATTYTPAPEDTDASIKAITDNIYTPNTTTIDGGKITTRSITAEALTVVGRPSRCVFWLSAQGATSYAADTIIGDLTGGQNSFKIKGTWNAINLSSNNGYSWAGTTNAARAIVNTKSISLAASGWTIAFKFYLSDLTTNDYFHMLDCYNGSNNKNRLIVSIGKTDKKIKIRSWNTSGTETAVITNLYVVTGKWYNLVLDGTSTTSITAYLSTDNDCDYSSQAVTVGTRAAIACPANCFVFANYAGVGVAYSLIGYIGYMQYFSRSLSANEIKLLMRTMTDTESGQITADRLAVDAIRSRNASGGSDGGYTTAGSKMDLSLGWLSFPKCCIDSDGKIKATDVDLTGKITATSGSIGGFLLQNGMLLGAGSDTSSNFMMLDYSTSSYEYDSQFNCGNILLEHWTTSSNTKYINQRTELKSDMIRMRSFSNGQQTSQSAMSSSCITVNVGGSNTAEALLVTGKVVVNGSVVHGSDENIKTEIKDVSTLEKLKKIRIKSWKYDEEKINQKEYTKELEQYRKGNFEEKPVLRIVKSDYLKEAPTHIGAMAGEFNEAFGTSNNSKDYISYTDEIGVALRAIQELAEQVDSLTAEIKALKGEETTKENKVVETDEVEPIIENPESEEKK